MNVSKNAAYGLMALAAIMWATSGTFTVLALQSGAKVMQVTVFSTVFTALILIISIAVFDRKSLWIKREDFIPLFVFSQITSTFFAIAWYMTVDLTGVATAVILLYAYPSIVTIASLFLLAERLGRAKALALPLTFVGCVFVAGGQDISKGLTFNALGVSLGIGTAVAGAVYYLWGKKFLEKHSANTLVLYMYVLSIPSLILIANPSFVLTTSISAAAWGYIFLIGLLPGTVGPVVSMVALKYIQASKASIVASIEPVAAVVIAYLVLAEKLSVPQGVGVALVFLGVLMLRLRESAIEKVPTEKEAKLPLER